MNLLILFSQPWRVGGAETHVEALIRGLSQYKIFLAVNEGSNEQKLKKLCDSQENLKVIKIQSRGINIFRWRKDIQKLSKLVETEKISVISAQQRTAGIWARLIYKKTRVPYIVTMHDPWHRAKFKSIYAKIFPTVVAVSKNLAMKLRADFGFKNEQIRTIHNGIDFEEFLPQNKVHAKMKLGLSSDEKIILHVSRLSRIKGSVSLEIIKSMTRILQLEPQARLVIIGEGPLRKKVEQAAAQFNINQKNVIIVHDFVNNIQDWYNAADVLVGEGRVAIETIACNRPVVAIRNAKYFIGAIRAKNIEYACGVNFDGNDVQVTADNLALAVEEAFTVNEKECLIIADYIKKHLSIEEMTQKYILAFQEIKK